MRALRVTVVCLTLISTASFSQDNVLRFAPSSHALDSFPFRNVSLPIETRLNDLISRLTIEDAINQTVARYGKFTPGIERLGIKPIEYITECLRGVRRENATGFPQALGLAASFSRDLMQRVATAVSVEVRAFYNHDIQRETYGAHGITCFSPVINILRHPLWGRNQETYGEDPYLSGELASQYVSGLQGDDPRYLRVSAGCKHFDAHGGPDTIPVRKFGFDAKIEERDLQMTFLPAFKKCIAAKPYNVMCSFNSINGVPSCANKRLLTDVLRAQWGYEGFVVSDDAAVEYIFTEHHYNSSFETAAVEAIKSGCNMELVGKFDPSYWQLTKALNEHLITKDELMENVRPVFLTRFLLGEFDPPALNPFNQITKDVVLSAEHQRLALEAAVKSFVLLKNDRNFLPLLKNSLKTVAVVGPMSNYTDGLIGDYSTDTDPSLILTPLHGIKKLAPNVQFASGCSNSTCTDYRATDVAAAVDGAQVVFVALGTGFIVEAENNDRSDIVLPGAQLQLLKDAVYHANGRPVVLLLFNGGPLDVTFAQLTSGIVSIVECFFPAMMTGEAIYRMLINNEGISSPAGRLPLTWPAYLNQVPNITDYTMKGRTYRYYTEDPLYPFGYGLSYTQFKYSDLKVTPLEVTKGQEIRVKVKVTNIGLYDADEVRIIVVQAYVSWPKTEIPVPRWQLVAFDRIHIASGKSETVELTIEASLLEVWQNPETGFDILEGEMTLYIGGQQPNQRVNVGSNVISRNLSLQH
ncbi:hypothetical protein CAPTEDRAFT_179825 [Capitella teleta]|uniref:Fibronectin type III-like domain-containing protein n=1 Tax=Capitella teleta TaxID=283909 RepID=R7TQQ4_CAPTE|nr:hypothetical protein CAPTEDRAFT_179825 [Capitella teleta]|eukprot:ELT96258.1 hypothetical protein CAPTEDRAFT_179825 [Capitella teleta]